MVAVEVESTREPDLEEAREPIRSVAPISDADAARLEQRGRSARQYVLALRTVFLASHKSGAQPSPEGPPQRVVDELQAIFSRYAGPDVDWTASNVWDDAFAAERLIVEVLDEDALEVELERRILEARDVKEDALAEFYAGRKQSPSKDAEGKPARLAAEQVKINRSLLSRLTRDLQWHYSQQDLKRRYSHAAQQRVVWTFIFSLAVFVVVMVLTFAFPPAGTPTTQEEDGAPQAPAPEQ